MKFAIAGLNHKTAPVAVRERMAVSDATLPAELERLKRIPYVREGMILSTCNRVEIAMIADDAADAGECARSFLSASGVPAEHLYSYEGRDAIRHLFRVASSLDSMVVGEPQILGQLKEAYARAKDLGSIDTLMEPVLSRAFNVAKRVRTETEIGESAVSVSYAAVELAREIFGSLAQTKVMLIGAGKMSELAAQHLHRSGASQIYVTNRTYEKAVAVASIFRGWIVDYQSFKQTLPTVDIVITSSAAPHYILTQEDVRLALRARRNKPIFFIDIAVPRNIDPLVGKLDNAFLYDIDDLQGVVERNMQMRRLAAESAERIIEEEVDRLEARLKSRDAAPAIVGLQTQFERIRATEIERVRAKLGTLTPQQEEAIEAATRAMINKIAHGPIGELRRAAISEEPASVTEMIKRMFRLEDR